jgi:hypothetical protein
MSEQIAIGGQRVNPAAVYVLVNETEPLDSGSDFQYSNSLHMRQDSEIIGVYTTLERAIIAAADYVRHEWQREEIDFTAIDWVGVGWFHDAFESGADTHTRVTLKEFTLNALASSRIY